MTRASAIDRLKAIGMGLALLVFAAPTPTPAPAAEPLLVGVFAGALACADCSGIATELTLVRKASGWAEGRYLLRQTYLGRSGPPVVTTGEWTTLRGDAIDPDAVVYELDPDRPATARRFVKRGEGRIQLLDAQMRPLPVLSRSILDRSVRALPTPAAVDCLRKGGLPNGSGCGPARSR